MPGLSRGLAMAGTVAAIILVLVAGAGGVLYAAEGAVPGDPLYGIDRAVESARLGLTSEPQAAMELLLSLAEERLLEAETVSGKGPTKLNWRRFSRMQTAARGNRRKARWLAAALVPVSIPSPRVWPRHTACRMTRSWAGSVTATMAWARSSTHWKLARRRGCPQRTCSFSRPSWEAGAWSGRDWV
jgi:hypothetical protein